MGQVNLGILTGSVGVFTTLLRCRNVSLGGTDTGNKHLHPPLISGLESLILDGLCLPWYSSKTLPSLGLFKIS